MMIASSIRTVNFLALVCYGLDELVTFVGLLVLEPVHMMVASSIRTVSFLALVCHGLDELVIFVGPLVLEPYPYDDSLIY